MAGEHHFLALDLGAESGRGELVTLAGGKVRMEEIRRWPNRPVRLAGTLYWDFPFLFAEVLETLRACAERGIKPASIGIDTWGVDFGLLDSQGKLLSNPVNYRDSRTDGIHDYSDPIMSRYDIYAATAVEPWQISSLFQLLAMQRDGSPLLDAAETFLNIPDLFNYFLTGEKRSEKSIVNTSNLMSTDGDWADEVIKTFNLPGKIFGEMIEPATVLGPPSAAVREQTGIGDVPVIATCGHDTSGAVAAVPGSGENWAFLSCGTWSILGKVMDRPIATNECLDLGFTNEYTVGSWFMCRNISGLWLIQELRRKWDSPDDPWDYTRMTAEAQKADDAALINAADESLLAPPDMEEALLALIRKSGQGAPAGRGGLIRTALESLALEYNFRLDAIGRLTGQRPEAVYMVGGGVHNKLLCQLTADACGANVYAGADQCTAVGNALVQALAVGVLKHPQEIRQVMRDSFELAAYEPKDPAAWADKRKRYSDLQGG